MTGSTDSKKGEGYAARKKTKINNEQGAREHDPNIGDWMVRERR
jgi:hypothetical protein